MPHDLEAVLTEALDDEYKARATYARVILKFGDIRPFTNILQAENRHVHALLPLFAKYGIPVPEDTWAERVASPRSLLEASRAGVQAEIENAAMYRRLLDTARDHADVQRVLLNLQRASQENHLPAFQRAVQRYTGLPPATDRNDVEVTGTPHTKQRAANSPDPHRSNDRGTARCGQRHSGFGGHHGAGCRSHGWGGGRHRY